MKFKVDLGKNIHIALAEQAGQITQEAAAAVNQIAQETAIDAHEQAKIYAKARLNTTADQYIAALSFNQISSNIWSVTLDESAEHLESGYGKFDMKPGLLKNAKKISKKGFKYRSIPMEQKGKGKAGTTAGDLKSDLKRLRGVFGDKGISKGADGKPILGKTLTFKRDQVGRWSMEGAAGTGIERRESGQIAMSNSSDFGRNLSGVVKYQYKHASGKVASQFIVYRTVSENPNSASKWIHGGFAGIHAFKDLEQWVHDQLNKRLRELFK